MKQVLQQPRGGAITVTEVPAPKAQPGCVLVRMAASIVSAGTERASSEFAGKNLLQKAKARPDLTREVLTKFRRDGLLPTITAVRSRLDRPSALGYSCAGSIVEVGQGVTDLAVADHVACSGAGYAVHAEFVCVPRLLTAKVPLHSAVTPEEAVFAALGAVAMHGIRTAEVKLGDVVAVIGLGLIGQLTLQLLKAAGCHVIGMDPIAHRAEVARKMGADAVCLSAEELTHLCLQHSSGCGADSVIITAETRSSDPVNLAGEIARDRGIVVAVGTVGIEIDRKTYYQKELDFRVSRSYGPGRYDCDYEQKGHDYPIGYVRWTETRNLEAFIQLLSAGRLNLQPLITHRFSIDNANEAYDIITGRRPETSLGVLITYPNHAEPVRELQLVSRQRSRALPMTSVSLGVLGAGNFATSTLLPALKRIRGVDRAALCSATGSHAHHAAEKFGFRICTTDEEAILNDFPVNAVLIATRHHLHAPQVMRALESGKHVFCEKPLCLTEAELANIISLYENLPPTQKPLLMVGFNRRFAPMALEAKSFLDEINQPLAMHYRINAGSLPRDHWINDPEQGGGRIIGEVCHFIDLLTFFAGESPAEVETHRVNSAESVVISLKFPSGSAGTIHYLTNGDRSFSKERLEIFGGGAVAVLTDFRRLELVRHGRKHVIKSRFHQDKGHRAELEAFFSALQTGGEPPIPFDQLVATTLASFRAADSRSGLHATRIQAAQFISRHSNNGQDTLSETLAGAAFGG